LFQEYGSPGFHGKIAAKWVFKRGVSSWLKMTDLPVSARNQLADSSPLLSANLETRMDSPDGACKLLLRYPDGASTEAVGMPGTQGQTFCISTQVGCPVKCKFCASGSEGLERNLTQAEILEQVLWLRNEMGDFHRLVVMGMGDAGFNLTPTLNALECLLDPAGMDLGARRVTLSTVAPKNAITTLANWPHNINVALSLHAIQDELRHELIPGLSKRTIEETLGEMEQLFAKNGREYTIEYVLLSGVNDSTQAAHELADLLRDKRCHINLIPYNPVAGLGFARPTDSTCGIFLNILKTQSLSATLRRSMGSSADAACGQLRRHTKIV
jgi:23S rRNA (adenine2503-C2)-methyltransferase